MQYGRVLIELFVIQVAIVAVLLLIPVEVITSLSPFVVGVLAAGIATVTVSMLYVRHRGRTSAQKSAAVAVQEGREMARRMASFS